MKLMLIGVISILGLANSAFAAIPRCLKDADCGMWSCSQDRGSLLIPECVKKVCKTRAVECYKVCPRKIGEKNILTQPVCGSGPDRSGPVVCMARYKPTGDISDGVNTQCYPERKR